ncbi:hypothetical protein GCM10009827_024610 [Dactylosporangium maewongense]|uniref:Uncharacterized protein n=1 Tax=Dactylosporangium maewongense TaxID=634393 RepID=A0ABN2A2W2_9ACTN
MVFTVDVPAELGRFFAEEIAAPLGVEFHVGVPDSVDPDRIAFLACATWCCAWTPRSRSAT